MASAQPREDQVHESQQSTQRAYVPRRPSSRVAAGPPRVHLRVVGGQKGGGIDHGSRGAGTSRNGATQRRVTDASRWPCWVTSGWPKRRSDPLQGVPANHLWQRRHLSLATELMSPDFAARPATFQWYSHLSARPQPSDRGRAFRGDPVWTSRLGIDHGSDLLHGLVFDRDGIVVYVNDATAVRGLGRRFGVDLAPVANVELPRSCTPAGRRAGRSWRRRRGGSTWPGGSVAMPVARAAGSGWE
jgi:hypothetical protein